MRVPSPFAFCAKGRIFNPLIEHAGHQLPTSVIAASALKFTGVEKNQLYYGDNLDVLRRYIKDESRTTSPSLGQAPTKPMLKEAAEAGFYKPPGLEDRYPRLQILTIEELLAGKGAQYPRMLEVTFKKAPKSRKSAEEQIPLASTDPDADDGPF
jgi:hypothetical protein